MDNSLVDCYGERASCRARDLPGELDHLFTRLGQTSRLLQDWWQLGGAVFGLAEPGDTDHPDPDILA